MRRIGTSRGRGWWIHSRRAGASGAGILAGAQSLALILCNPLIGRALDRLGSYDLPTLCLGLWALPGGLLWLLWRPATRFVRIPRAQALG